MSKPAKSDGTAKGDPQLKKLRRSLFLVSAPAVFISFALPLRAEDLGATAFEIGMLYSLFTAAVFVIRPLAGLGLDLIGRRPFFLLAILLYLIANMLFALSDGVAALYMARLSHGLGFAIVSIAASTIAADCAAPTARSAAMGGNIAAQTQGGMAGAFVAFTLVGVASAYAWVWSFWIFSGISFLALVYAGFALPETRPAATRRDENEKFRTPPGYLRILIIIFLAAFAGALIQPFYLVYLRARYDVELYMLATAFLPMGVAAAVLPGLMGRIFDRYPRALVIAAGLLVAGICYPLVPNVDGFFAVIGVFLTAMIGAVLVDLTKNAWVVDLSAENAIGRAFGLAALAAGAGAALGPILGGIIYDRWGADYLFYGAGVILATTSLAAAAMRPRRS